MATSHLRFCLTAFSFWNRALHRLARLTGRALFSAPRSPPQCGAREGCPIATVISAARPFSRTYSGRSPQRLLCKVCVSAPTVLLTAALRGSLG